MNFGDWLQEKLHSRMWRTIQNVTYSIGASVVLIGALGKLEHWKMASELLMIGMSVEALIFFISAFEPLLDTPEWKRIFPQLREEDDPDAKKKIFSKIDKEYSSFFGSGGLGGGSGTGTGSSIDGGAILFQDLPAEQIKKLNESFVKLTKAAEGISDLSNATVATGKFVSNLENVSQSIESIVDSNKKVSDKISAKTNEISETYKLAAEKIKQTSDQASVEIVKSVGDLSASLKLVGDGIKASGDKSSTSMAQSLNDLSGSVKITAEGLKNTGEKFSTDVKESSKIFGENLQKSATELNDSYRKVADSLSGGFKGLEKSSGKYVESIERLNKNLGALNSAYELHLKGAGKVEDVVKDYSNSVGEIGKLLHASVEETRKFNESTKEINENIQALNKVYGRMLGALNTKK
jgi:gliding motility-associated protein GldL